LASQLTDQSLKRLVEGIIVQRATPNSKLVLSGGSWLTDSSDARVMAEVARSLGVKDDDMIFESESKDTKDQAVLLGPVLQTNRFILVTSAAHMPRSIALFNKEGMRPSAAPTGHHVEKRAVQDPRIYFPCGPALRKSETAIYEYLGLIWAKYRKLI